MCSLANTRPSNQLLPSWRNLKSCSRQKSNCQLQSVPESSDYQSEEAIFRYSARECRVCPLAFEFSELNRDNYPRWNIPIATNRVMTAANVVPITNRTHLPRCQTSRNPDI